MSHVIFASMQNSCLVKRLQMIAVTTVTTTEKQLLYIL